MDFKQLGAMMLKRKGTPGSEHQEALLERASKLECQNFKLRFDMAFEVQSTGDNSQ